MQGLDQRSPSATSPGARGEAGERVCDAPNAARSLDLTWEEFCDRYKPGNYGRYVTPGGLQRDADQLQRLLKSALRGRVERTTAGSCYGNAA